MSFVYAVCAWDGRVKIGFSATPSKRIASLKSMDSQQLSELMVVPGSRQHEKFLHQLLAAYRIKGEWFRASEEVMAAIDRVKSGDWLGFSVENKADRSEASKTAEAAARCINKCETFLDLPKRSDLTAWKFMYRPTEPLVGELVALLQETVGKIEAVRASLNVLEKWAITELEQLKTPTQYDLMGRIDEIRKELHERVAASSAGKNSPLAAELEACIQKRRDGAS